MPALTPITVATETLEALVELIHTFTGLFPSSQVGSLLYPQSTTYPSTTQYPLGATDGTYPSSAGTYPSLQEEFGLTNTAIVEGTETLTPLMEA